jgi:hypothetical protein
VVREADLFLGCLGAAIKNSCRVYRSPVGGIRISYNGMFLPILGNGHPVGDGLMVPAPASYPTTYLCVPDFSPNHHT